MTHQPQQLERNVMRRILIAILSTALAVTGLATLSQSPANAEIFGEGQAYLESLFTDAPFQAVRLVGEHEKVSAVGLNPNALYTARARNLSTYVNYSSPGLGGSPAGAPVYYWRPDPQGNIPYSAGWKWQCITKGDYGVWWKGIDTAGNVTNSNTAVIHCVDNENEKVGVKTNSGIILYVSSGQFTGVRQTSSTGPMSYQPGDYLLNADKNGRGITTPTLYRPSTGKWQWSWGCPQVCVTGSDTWGIPGDLPYPADFDGDFLDDTAVYRPSDTNWYIKGSRGAISVIQWGAPGDIPVLADYDGDGKTDLAQYRPSTGNWHLHNVRRPWLNPGCPDCTIGDWTIQWGIPNDRPLVGPVRREKDPNSGRTVPQIMAYRPSTGEWIIRSWSPNRQDVTYPLGGGFQDEPILIKYIQTRNYYNAQGQYQEAMYEGEGSALAQLVARRPTGTTSHWYILDIERGVLYGEDLGNSAYTSLPGVYP